MAIPMKTERDRRKVKWKAMEDEGGYISLHFPMLDHAAFRALSEAGIRVLLHCYRKAYGPDRYRKIFKFTYPEAKNKLGISDSTFRRAMKQLHDVGFIDYYSPGGLRCENDPFREDKKKDPKGYQLSLRWKRYGTPDFEARHEGHYVSIHG
jgi:hypothetical protein